VKRAKIEEQDKIKARKATQNQACRNYRMKKKEHYKELETKLSVQEEELKQLRKEVTVLKSGTAFESIDPATSSLLEETKQIVEKLDEAIKNNADDQYIQYWIQLYFRLGEKRIALANKDIDKLVNPLTQAKLATMGYTPALQTSVSSILSGSDGNDWWDSYDQEAYLTPLQKEGLNAVRERYWRLDSELRNERVVIDTNIKTLFLQNLKLLPNLRDLHSKFVSGSASKLDMADVVQIAEQLKCLKKNYMAQSSMNYDLHVQFTRILTPRQQAILLLRFAAVRAFDWPAHVQTLCSAWQIFGEDKIGLEQNPL